VVAKVGQESANVGREPAVSADHVSKVYSTGRVEVWALRDASLSVAQGEFVAVMGPSGSGKTTLLNLIAGLDVPTSGTVHVQGQCVSTMNDDAVSSFRRRHVGFIYQSFNFFPDLTIEENVGVPLMLDGCGLSELRERVGEALRQLGLYERRTHLPAEISGGELQRAAIARALVAKPGVLLADEPTGNLDSLSGERVLIDMRRAVDEMGQTVVLVTHDAKAAAYADRTERLLDGRFESK
jgi:putative ABC transport system ATP-binding protein